MDLGNYRPISLSNVDYKILAYVLTERLQPAFDQIIHPSQTAYLKGKFLEANIHKIQDVINYTRDNSQENLVVLFLDFRKAFDSVSHKYMLTLLQKLQILETLIDWVYLL